MLGKSPLHQRRRIHGLRGRVSRDGALPWPRFAGVLAGIEWALVVIVLVALGVTSVRGEVWESFEGPEPTWTLADADCAAQLAKHLRQFKDAYRGQGCEYLRLQTGQGSYVYLSHEVTPAPVIDELSAAVWVKSDRPGIQLRLRVVLPRTEDPRTGKPLTTFLVGSSYQQPGTWQQLVVDHPVLLLQRQQAVLRSQFGQQVDVRQAYVDRVVLNAYGGSNVTNLWVDDLELQGVVTTSVRREVLPLGDPQRRSGVLGGVESGLVRGVGPRGAGALEAGQVSAGELHAGQLHAGQVHAGQVRMGSATSERELPRIHGSQLLIGQKPWLPRVVRHAGQSLIEIKDLGFNTVLFTEQPTAAQLSDAAALGLWLVVPPPADGFGAGGERRAAGLDARGEAREVLAAARGSGSEQEPAEWSALVLAWNLVGEHWREQAPLLRQVAPAWSRPLLSVGHDDWSRRSRVADLVVADQAVAGRGDGVVQGRRQQWQEVARQLRPGSIWWATIACPQGIADVRATIGADLRQAVYEAVTSGARGIVFEYSLRDQQHPDWSSTAAMLRAVNAELQLLDPWIAGGRGVEFLGQSESGHRLWVLATDRARLVVALHDDSFGASGASGTRGSSGTRATGKSANRHGFKPVAPLPARSLAFVDHGASTSADAYGIYGADFRPLRRRRVAGGIEVTIPDPAAISLVVLTQEPLVVNYLARTLNDRRLSFRP